MARTIGPVTATSASWKVIARAWRTTRAPILISFNCRMVSDQSAMASGSDDDQSGILKIVMTGAASDPTQWQQHIGGKARRELLAKRAKDPKDPLKLVIVRDMWRTGFDAPSMHTMYIDKPMRGHGLMQAIARGNRVFRD